MNAYNEYVAAYNGIPKTKEAVKAALQTQFPFVKFQRTRVWGTRQTPAVINLQWLGEDETSPVFKLLLKKIYRATL